MPKPSTLALREFPSWLRAASLPWFAAALLLSGCSGGGTQAPDAQGAMSTGAALDPVTNDVEDPWVVAGVEAFSEADAVAKEATPSVSALLAIKEMANGENYLSDLDWVSSSTDYGPVERDQSIGSPSANDGNRPLIINGASYVKGLGVHGDSEVVFALNAQCTTFQAVAGINDYKGRFALGNRGSMIFQVLAEGNIIYESTVLTGTSAALPITLSISGVNQLKLVTKNNGVPGSSSDSNYDHGDWADAKVKCTGISPPPVASPPVTSPPTTNPQATSWIECGVEFGVCSFTGTRPVRYGANSTFVIKELTAQNGGVPCTNATFGGDPLVGVTKRCYLESNGGSTPPAPAPAISSFSATPGTIDAGAATTLSWTTTDAQTLSISPNVGMVTGTMATVRPAATTTYTLTAANATGNTTRTATVTVTAAVPQPPSSGSASRPTPNNTAPASWSFCSELYTGAGCEFDGMRQVRIGTGNSWIVKKVLHRLYGFECSNSFFGGDAAPGQKQHCEVADTREEGTLPTPSTCFDASLGCTTVDLTRIPLGSPGSSELRIKAETAVLAQTPDGGSFRTECEFSHMAFNDPIVYPGQPGLSHLHAFFGNTGADAFSTPTSIANSGNSTCSGGIANRTAYWIPALIDTRTGAPIVPDNTIWYYKVYTVPAYPISANQPLPSGLRMIAGDMRATGPQKMTGWSCFGRGGTDSASIPTICTKGEYVTMTVTFPSCWDGKNLDSTDHKSHMSYSLGAEGCPQSHPVPVPEIKLNVRYLVQNAADPAYWRLSSDHSPNAAGLSAHADWFDGWIPSVRDTWVRNCSQRAQNCEVNILGDGTRLY